MTLRYIGFYFINEDIRVREHAFGSELHNTQSGLSGPGR